MKKLFGHILLMVMIVAVAAGCSKSGNGDSDALLRTIPADASSVAMLNLQQAVKSVGGKTDGKTIELPAELQEAVAGSKALRDSHKQIFKDICNGETGVSMTSIAFFSAARSYFTGLLDDPDKFVAYVEHLKSENRADSLPAVKAVEQDGMRQIGDVAVIGNQFWMCVQGTPDTDQLRYYQTLNGNQSYASAEAATLLLQQDKVLTYVADVKRTLDRMPEAGYSRVAMSMMFDDIAYLAGSASINGKDVVSNSVVLNSKMKPAKLLLPAEKIDVSVVKALDKNADIFLAAGLSGKLTKKIGDAITSAFGQQLSAIATPLAQIDGTTAVCGDGALTGFEARVQTTGKDFAGLSQLLQMIPGAGVTRDGNVLTVRYGQTVAPGSIAAADAAAKFKGAWMAMLASDVPGKGMSTLVRLAPDDNSLKLDIEMENGLEALMISLLQ